MRFRKYLLYFIPIIILASAYYTTQLTFQFDFEQFFPQGDEDLAFFKKFKSDFESDDNFLLIAVPHEPDVFDSVYLNQIKKTAEGLRSFNNVEQVQSLVTMKYPVKTPFGITTLPIIHIDDKTSYEEDRKMIKGDERFMSTLVNEKMNMLVILLKTSENLTVSKSESLIGSIEQLFKTNGIETYHMLGRAYFQVELVKQQKHELILTSAISALLVSLILFFIFRSIKAVVIAMSSLGISLVVFLGLLGVLGRELNIMSALYPVLILIVGTSDIVHIMAKYFDELKKGKEKNLAIKITIKEIGIATFLTSATTAIGFVTLLTSRLQPIQEFGVNAALGVMVTFAIIISLSILVLPLFDDWSTNHRVMKSDHWSIWIEAIYQTGKNAKNKIIIGFTIATLLCIYGIFMISTNYNVMDNLPKGSKIANDFMVFENEFAGFRPLEFAITTNSGYQADDFRVVHEIDKLEQHLISLKVIKATLSQATLYKSLNRMNHGNDPSSYKFPEDEVEYLELQSMVKKMKNGEATILVNKDNTKTRLSSRINDIGADSIRNMGLMIDKWISQNIDSNIIEIRRTGTGLIMDKNGIYVTQSLLKGLLLAIFFISLLMALLLRDWKMVILAFIPNFIPLLFAGALLGYFGINLEAGVSIIFAVIFGIAVDDTIHFLSRFKLCRNAGMNIEESIHITFKETGKAIIFTTIILFFGFLVMMFSNNQPTFTVGLLVAITLVSALICDLYLLPVLMRLWLKN